MSERVRAAAGTSQPGAGPPVEKVVLYTIREGVSEDEVAAMPERARALLGAIPGVERIAIGLAVDPAASYRYCALLRFRDPGVIAVYNTHPNHEAFLQQEWRPKVAAVLPIEYALVL